MRFSLFWLRVKLSCMTRDLLQVHVQATPPALAFQTPKGAFSGALPFLLGSGLLGTIGIFVHMANAGALTATWFRCAFGLLGLTVWLVWHKQIAQLLVSRAAAPWVLLASGLMVLGWALFFAAIERTSTGVAVVLFHMQPMWVLVLGAVCLGERPGTRRTLAVLMAMVGLLLATGVLEQASCNSTLETSAQYWIGVAFCLLGAFFTACVTVIARRLRGIPAGVLAWWQCAAGSAVLWVWPMQQGWPTWGTSWLWLGSLGIIHTGLAYTLMYSGMAKLTTSRIAVFQFVYPAIAILIDWQYFGHQLGALQLVGIAIMGIAIWHAERGSTVLQAPHRE